MVSHNIIQLANFTSSANWAYQITYPMGTTTYNVFLKDMVKDNNALEVGIEQSIAWFNAVEDSWNKKAYTDGRLFKCDEYCGS